MTPNMRKYDTLIFLKMGPKHLGKTHAIRLYDSDDSIQDQRRLRNLYGDQNFEGCRSSDFSKS